MRSSLPRVLVALLAVAVALCLGAVRARNRKAALLGDATPFLPTNKAVVYVSVLTALSSLDDDDDDAKEDDDRNQRQQQQTEEQREAADAAIEDLVASVRDHGGSVGYLGRCWHVLISSEQFPSESCDFVVTTVWERKTGEEGDNNQSSQIFERFRNSQRRRWKVHQAQRMVIDPTTSVVAAVVLHGVLPLAVRAYSALTGFEYPLDEKLEIDDDPLADEKLKEIEEEEGKHAVTPANLLHAARIFLGDTIDGAVEAERDRVLMWSFMQLESLSAEDEKLNRRYMTTFLPILAHYGGGPIHLGGLERPDNAGGDDGSFQELAAAYYPSRAFLAKTFESKWLYRVAQNKRGGADSFAVVTVPYNTTTSDDDASERMNNS